MNDQAIFMSLVRTPRQRNSARLMIESLRAFGGNLGQSSIWLFEHVGQSDSDGVIKELVNNDPNIEIHPLTVPDSVKRNWFAAKVCACARAEELVGSDANSLIWMGSDCLVIQPPVLFALGESYDAAFRPVHIRNIGQPVSAPPDEFWKRVYQSVGIEDIQVTVESFVDDQLLRAYYNSHAFAVSPSKGLMSEWFQIFEQLVGDQDFQMGACQDGLHQTFLHQAVLSALVAVRLEPERIRMLPPEYNYPYNLQGQVPDDKRVAVLNELVNITCEDRSLNPEEVADIQIDDPLRSWLGGYYLRKIG